jgi:5-methyltetrahydrofolate--homocysteine methyltransferase
MIIVGEKINTTLAGVEDAIRVRNKDFISKLAIEQAEGGANYIDVNCATMVGEEVESLAWLVKTVQEVVDLPCCIDSPEPKALDAGLAVHKGKALINSTTLEKNRYDSIVPLVQKYNARIVALVIDEEHGMSHYANERIEIGIELVKKLHSDGIAYDDIFIDPLIQPISTGPDLANVALDTIEGIRNECPEVHFMCGLSNVSFGLPKRGIINYTFMAMCIRAGLDGAVMDPTNKAMKKIIYASEAIVNRDPYGMNFMKAARSGTLE